MNQIAIIYNSYYDFEAKKITIGGIQAYITNLVEIINQLGYKVTIFQTGKYDNTAILGESKIQQFAYKSVSNKKFLQRVCQTLDVDKSLVIFATDCIIPYNIPFKHTIAIQHGISWDMPRSKNRPQLLMYLAKARRNWSIIRKVNSVDKVVCVDYNFINWLRAEVDKVNANLVVIPNYTEIALAEDKPKDCINIIFARRLWWYRGTRVFADAIVPILQNYPNVNVTIAGSGPDEAYLHDRLGSFENIIFTTYESSQSMAIHADKHIAVVPTIGSEGTSLSLLEAMSSQCAVIASNVGGMTNIILDGYNGKLVDAGDYKALKQALEGFIENPTLLKNMSKKAYETVKSAFSYEKWREKWVDVIEEMMEND